jgi:hypothetical protein
MAELTYIQVIPNECILVTGGGHCFSGLISSRTEDWRYNQNEGGSRKRLASSSSYRRALAGSRRQPCNQASQA